MNIGGTMDYTVLINCLQQQTYVTRNEHFDEEIGTAFQKNTSSSSMKRYARSEDVKPLKARLNLSIV